MLSGLLESELENSKEELHKIEYKVMFAMMYVNTGFELSEAKITFPLFRLALEQCDNCYIVCLTSV